MDAYIFRQRSTPSASIVTGEIPIPQTDPKGIDPGLINLGIHSKILRHALFTSSPDNGADWSNHGICGRGVLLDLVNYYTQDGASLPYNPMATHGFTVADLMACAKKQGITEFRRGDILLLRVGFIRKYYDLTKDERAELSGRPETLSVFYFSSYLGVSYR